jgi:hypothetical protein
MKFRLEKKSSNRALTKFHILNSADETVGSVNVPPSQESDLLKHWTGAKAAAAKPATGVFARAMQRRAQAAGATVAAAAKQPTAAAKLSAALRSKGPRLSKEAGKQAILRGC